MSKYKLPNGIEIEGKLYNLAEVDEIRGKHQNMLVNPSPKTPIDHVEPILIDLIIDITTSEGESISEKVMKKDVILHKLPIQDIQFLLVKVREVTYGKDYLINLECPHCEAKNSAKLDLSTLAVMPREDKIEEKDMKLPKEGIEFRYRHMSLSQLLKMAAEDGESNFTKEMMTSLTSFMLGSLGDSKEIKPSHLDELRGSDLDYIRDNVPKFSEIDHKIEHTCSNSECKKDFEQELPTLSADFLLRMRT